jgi:hypothetical protein
MATGWALSVVYKYLLIKSLQTFFFGGGDLEGVGRGRYFKVWPVFIAFYIILSIFSLEKRL